MAWKNLFYSNYNFLEHYFRYLKLYSKKGYLYDFFASNKNEIREKLGIIANAKYIFITGKYYHNAEIIRNSFTTSANKPHLNVNLKETNDDGNTVFQIANTTFFPVEIIDIVYKDSSITNSDPFIIDGKKEKMPLTYNDVEYVIDEEIQKKF